MSAETIKRKLMSAGRDVKVKSTMMHFNDYLHKHHHPSKWPKWVHQYSARQKTRGPEYKQLDLVQILMKIHKKRGDSNRALPRSLRAPTMQSLRQITGLVNIAIPERLALLRNVASKMQEHGKNTHTRELASQIELASKDFNDGQMALVQSDGNSWWSDLVEFVKTNIRMILCVVGEIPHSPLLKKVKEAFTSGSIGGMVSIGLSSALEFVEKMFNTAKNMIKHTLDSVSNEVNENNQLLAPGFFTRFIIKMLNDVAKIEPTVQCIVPIFEGFLAKPAVKNLENNLVTGTNKFFSKWILGEGGNVWVYMFDKVINGLGMSLAGPGNWAKARITATSAIMHMETVINNQFVDMIDNIDGMAPGEVRSEAIHHVQQLLDKKVDAQAIIKIAFKVIQVIITNKINEKAMEILPFVWDCILNFFSVIILPAVTFGLNMAAATGSVATEWISSVSMNVVQGIFDFVQTHGKTAFFAASPMIISKVVSWFLDMLFTLALKPVKELVVPLEGAVKIIVTAIEKGIAVITSLIPKSIVNILQKQVKLMFTGIIKVIAPNIGDQTALSIQVARALVVREKQSVEQWKQQKAIRGESVNGTVPLSWQTVDNVASPAPTAAPTPPTPSPTPKPTAHPTHNYDWGNDGPEDSVTPEQIPPEPYEPGDVDVDPANEVPSQDATYARNKALQDDPIFKNVNGWLRSREGKAEIALIYPGANEL